MNVWELYSEIFTGQISFSSFNKQRHSIERIHSMTPDVTCCHMPYIYYDKSFKSKASL